MYNCLKGKKVLVTGGSGLIGIPLVKKLVETGAYVRVVSLDEKSPFEDSIDFIKGDICNKEVCENILKGIDVVFHLAGIKGGIGLGQKKASTFLVKNILMNMQIMEAARKAQVDRFLYASSICIYPPAQVFEEKNAFRGFPHPSDKFGGMAKLVGEMQIEAYKLQYDIENFLIVRPANTYGPYDNFNPESALIIPALIYRAFDGENPLKIWGDGTTVRDFVFADDVADFMLLMTEKNENISLNVGSGEPVTIKSIAEKVVQQVEKVMNKKIPIVWDSTKPSGEKYRVTSIEKAKSVLGWTPLISLDSGIEQTVRWYNDNKSNLINRYSIISEE